MIFPLIKSAKILMFNFRLPRVEGLHKKVKTPEQIETRLKKMFH
jgi:hypothetical protein